MSTLLRSITRFDSSKLAPWMALRNAFGVAIPLIAGAALHNPVGGLVAATGALNSAFSDGDDPYLHRARRMLAATAFVALAVFAGRLSGADHAVAVTLEAACAFAAGMLIATGQTAGDIGAITLVTLIVFAAEPASFSKALTSGLLVAAGGSLQTVLSIALWPVRRFGPEARALAALYLSLARTAESQPDAAEAPPSSDSIVAARSSLAALTAGGKIESERYFALFNQAERIRLALLTLTRLRVRIAREPGAAACAEIVDRALDLAARLLSSIAASLAAGVKSGPHTEGLAELRNLAEKLRGPSPGDSLTALRADARRQLDALSGQLRMATELAAHTTPAGLEEFDRQESSRPWRLRLSGVYAVLRANLTLQSAVCRHAVRLAACVALADFVARGMHTHRGYWAPMTAAIVLKPDFAATFSRGVLRLAGTFAGLMLATGLFALLSPSHAVQILLIAAFMFLMRWAGGINYGVLVVALTGLVVLLFAVTGVPPAEVALARAMNTAIGGLIALAANRLWPTWERARINEAFATLLDSYRDYFQAVRDGFLQPGLERDPAYAARLDRVRQAGRVARSNLQASFERFRIEPGATPAAVAALLGLLATSHRLIHAFMALEAGLYHSEAVPPRAEFAAFANAVDTTLYFLAASMRGSAVNPADFPDLREAHHALETAADPHTARHALVNTETDRATNSLNTLAVNWAAYRAGVQTF